IGVGLPGVTHAFGRRRRCSPCAPVTEDECGAPMPGVAAPTTPPMCVRVCPQSLYATINGVYYYHGLCSNNCTTVVNVASSVFISCPVPCSTTNLDCIDTSQSSLYALSPRTAAATPDPDVLLLSTGLISDGVAYL